MRSQTMPDEAASMLSRIEMASYVGLDIGTSAAKAVACDARGRMVATATAGYSVQQPRPSWCEQDPRVWWAAACRVLRDVCREVWAGGDRGREIAAVGLTGQMHGSVFLDAALAPLRPALLWNDQRTEAECAAIERAAGGRGRLIGLVRNPALTGYTAPKVLWLRRHEPRRYQRLRYLLLPKDYVGLMLTGQCATDVSDASGTLLLDVGRRTWCGPLLRRLGIEAAILPRLHESTEVRGTVTSRASRGTGLREGTPVVAGGGDQAAGGVGMGIVEEGEVSVTIGTSGVVFAACRSPAENAAGTLQSFCHAVPGRWCVFGCMLSAGGSLQWLRNTVYRGAGWRVARGGVDAEYERIIGEARAAPAGSDGLFFLPHLTGERCPYADPGARGAWIGLTARHGRGHLARAVLEGVTFGLAEQVELLRALGIRVRGVRAAGGGARSAWWRQLMADVFGCPVATVNTSDAAAYGAALLAAVGDGAFRSVGEACRAAIRTTSVVRPRAGVTRVYGPLRVRFRRLYEALRRERAESGG